MFFTIITCTYNAAEVLQRTLDSVSRQTWPHVQHIIIDGLSTDGTVSMAKKYKAANADVLAGGGGYGHRITLISEKDNGLYDAMNKGLQMAQGDYIVFLNAGDSFPDSKTLEVLAEQLSTYRREGLPGVLYGNTDIVNGSGYNLGKRRLQPPERLSWRSFRKGMLICHQAFYARGDIARNTPYDTQYRFSADVDWCIRVIKTAEEMGLPLHNSHLTLCNYLDGGLTAKNHRASLIERFCVMRRHYGLCTTLFMHFWFLLCATLRIGR